MAGDATSILIVGSEEFGQVAEGVLKTTLPASSFVRSVSWEAATPIWSNRLFQETDLFILEMFRQYPTGFRAEGLIAGAMIAEKGAKPLIVSPFQIDALNATTLGNLAISDGAVNGRAGSGNPFSQLVWFWSVNDGDTLINRAELALGTNIAEHDIQLLLQVADGATKNDQLYLMLHKSANM
jgi:hypothetical protein